MTTITIKPAPGRVQVRFNGEVVADSARAVLLHEGSRSPVVYIPREDARMDLYRPTATRTTCPWKGEASYFSLEVAGRTARDAVWSYENPKPGAEGIAGHLAYYPDRVDAIELA